MKALAEADRPREKLVRVGADALGGVVVPRTTRQLYRDGFIVGVSNPKSTLFFLAVLPQFVRPEDVADAIPCGPDLDRAAEAILEYAEAGFTDVALVQIGDEGQSRFLEEAAEPLLERLRSR